MVSVNLLRRRLRGWLAGDKLLASILKNSGYLITSNVATGLLALAQGILVARMLGAGEYGKLVVAMAVVSTINALTSSRLGEFVVKYLTEALEENSLHRGAAIIKFSYLVEMVFSVLAFLLIIIFAPLLSKWFLKSSEGTTTLIIYALSLFANFLLETSGGILQVFKQFRLFAKLAFLQSALILLFVMIAYATNAGLRGVLVAYVAGALLQTFLFQRFSIRLLNEKLGNGWIKTPLALLNGDWTSLSKFLFNTNIGTTLSLITKTSDPLWLGYFRGPIEAGYYKLALSLANLLAMPISALAQVFFPDITLVVKQNNLPRLKSLLRKGTLIALSWLLPASIACYLLSQIFIPMLYGRDFLPAIPALALLLVGLGIANCLFWTRAVLVALEKIAFATHINIVMAFLKILFTLLLVPRYGYLANAGLLSLSYIVGFFAMLIYIQIEINRRATRSFALL